MAERPQHTEKGVTCPEWRVVRQPGQTGTYDNNAGKARQRKESAMARMTREEMLEAAKTLAHDTLDDCIALSDADHQYALQHTTSDDDACEELARGWLEDASASVDEQ